MSEDRKQRDLNLSDLASALPSNSFGLNAIDRAGLVNALKNKLHSMPGKRADVMDNLSPKVKQRVVVLREIQCKYDELESKFNEERAALEAKYQNFYEPLYTKRYEIVNGLVEVNGVVNESLEYVNGDDIKEYAEGKGVPNFWITAMKTNDVLCEEIHEPDEEALKHLRDIKCSKLDDFKGFKLDFFFNPNPYFKNSVLSKTYHMIVDDADPILEKATGTVIEWFSGKCLTQKVLKKKPKKGSKNTKMITKTEICASFFNFFNPPEIPGNSDELDEEAAEQLQDQMEQDYDIGSTIRDKIIPHAVSWFTGEAAQDLEDIENDEDEDDEEEDEEEDEGDDDEDEDYEEEEVIRTNKKQPSSRLKQKEGGEVQQVDRPPDCKQQ